MVITDPQSFMKLHRAWVNEKYQSLEIEDEKATMLIL